MIEQIEENKNELADTSDKVRHWLREIDRAEKYFRTYQERCKKITKLFRVDKDSDLDESLSSSKYNIYWSSMQTKKSMIFDQMPKGYVKRRGNGGGAIARVAASILETCVDYQNDNYNLLDRFKQSRDDFMLYARGQMWVRYIPTVQDDMILKEEVQAEFLQRGDYLHSPDRTEDEITWKARRTWLTRKEAKNRFGEEIANRIQLTNVTEDEDRSYSASEVVKEQFGKAEIWEIWSKTDKKVYWVSKGLKEQLLDVADDPLQLKDFFPCPRAAYGTMTTDSTVPIPDWILVQDIIRQINEITAREELVSKTIAVKGVYNAAEPALASILKGDTENRLVAVDNWIAFSQSGGLESAIGFLPIEMLVSVLKVLGEIKDRKKMEYYELTGDSDIMRGFTNATETATAQNIKSSYLNTRLSASQKEMQRFARDIIAIKGEIIAKHFQPETIARMAGLDTASPEEQQAFQSALELLKSDIDRNYRIDIETDSTVAPDDEREKNTRIEFTTAISQFIGQGIPMALQIPQSAPLISELLKFIVKGFKVGREIESVIDQTAQMVAQSGQSQQQQPDPKTMQAQQDAQMKMQESQAKLQLAQQKQDGDMQVAMQKMQSEYEIKLRELEAKLAMEQRKQEIDTQIRASESQAKIAQARQQAAQRSINENIY